jgi:hypothetical protein
MDSLLPTCAHKFGATLALDQCFRMLADLFALEAQMNGTLERCPELGSLQNLLVKCHFYTHQMGSLCAIFIIWKTLKNYNSKSKILLHSHGHLIEGKAINILFNHCSPPQSTPSLIGPAIVHNRQHFLGPCTALELFCLRFLFPLLQLLSLAGNVFNLLVYRLPYFSGSSAVHFLRAKALANLLFVQSRLFEV